MPSIQSAEQIQALLARLLDKEIATLQVLGFNSLKSLSPTLETVIGERILGSHVMDRIITVLTSNLSITFDLQRTGRLVWLESGEPYRLIAGAPRPTVRLLLADGSGFDLTEPAKTKRIAVTLTTTAQ